MSGDEKGALGRAAASDADPRTAEVLRALQRARGTIASQDSPTAEGLPESVLEALASEVLALREERSRATSFTDEMARRFSVLQKGLEVGLGDLRVAADAVQRQAGVVAARLEQQRKQIAVLSAMLAFLLLAGVPYVWNVHRLAQSTHDILQQILENQTKAQSAKGGRR